jgi:hypothetical protein
MTKIINIHTGEEREYIKPPEPNCSICDSEFSLEEEGGTKGYFGMLPVWFCPFCLSSVLDMAKQLLDISDGEEKEEE